MSGLRSKVIRLAYEEPSLRADLLPVLKQGAGMKRLLGKVLDLIPPDEHQDLYVLMEEPDLEGLDWFFERHRVKGHPDVRKFMELI